MARDLVGCILSTAGLSGVQDREGSVVVVIVHQTAQSHRLSHAQRKFPSSHVPKHQTSILRPSAERVAIRIQPPRIRSRALLMHH